MLCLNYSFDISASFPSPVLLEERTGGSCTKPAFRRIRLHQVLYAAHHVIAKALSLGLAIVT